MAGALARLVFAQVAHRILKAAQQISLSAIETALLSSKFHLRSSGSSASQVDRSSWHLSFAPSRTAAASLATPS